MAARKPAPERKSRSGPTQPEWDRKNVQVKLRLTALAATALREGAERDGKTASAYVEDLVLAAVPEAD